MTSSMEPQGRFTAWYPGDHPTNPKLLRKSITGAGIPGTWCTPGSIDDIPDSKGAYVVLLRLDEPVEIALPGRAQQVFPPALYAYAGSARGPGGIRARVRRHFRSSKKLHWHIDRLTTRAAEITALAVPGGHECELIGRLLNRPGFHIVLKGFGSSDCRRCDSHLLTVARAAGN